MFVVVRGFNLAMIVVAQYITAIFIMAPKQSFSGVLLDRSLFALIIASVVSIASGYIINNFYDSEKDSINRPQQVTVEQIVSQNTKLMLYFVLNILVIIAASYVSFRAVMFFSVYIFGIWFYSHKIKKRPLIGNLTSAILTITPFFAIFLYYKNFSSLIFVFGFYLFLILSMRELVKDLQNLKGDLLQNYNTIPVIYGEKYSKLMILILTVCNVSVTVFLLKFYVLERMDYFFYASISLLFTVLLLLQKAQSRQQYSRIQIILKFLVLLGVFSIVLLNPGLILSKIL
jgi:4-hydroxybenzoate polyprenyltransferase